MLKIAKFIIQVTLFTFFPVSPWNWMFSKTFISDKTLLPSSYFLFYSINLQNVTSYKHSKQAVENGSSI